MTAREELAAELGVEAADLAFLDDLDEAQVALVLAGFRAATERQQEQIDAAVREALQHIPRVLRGPIHKMLFRNG